MAVRHIYEDEAFLGQLTKKKETAPPDAIDEDASSFIQAMLSENLNHARHVENERLTYCTVATALFGAAAAFIG
ncbi:MAG: hypothetical protein IJP07_03025, partial [Firmicutes bacterium]|nr:hypothetical protein [Bacillota bacterium]